MPGFDGTGPNSMGAMTGGARGYCVKNLSNNGARFFGGRGLGQGGRQGRRFRAAAFNGDFLRDSAQVVSNDLEMLKNRSDELLSELKSVDAKISMLEKEKN